MPDPTGARQQGMQIRVLICDREPLLRAGLRAILQAQPRITVSGECDDWRQVHSSAKSQSAQVVLLGGTPPAQHTARVVQQLSQGGNGSAVPMILIADPGNDNALLSAIKCGVRGFVSRRTTAQELAAAVHAVVGGGAFLAPSLALPLLDWLADRMPELTGRSDSTTGDLSSREREVLLLMSRGNSNSQIGRILRIRETTVRSHIYHILTKLNLNSRTEAVLYGYQYGLSSGMRDGLKEGMT